MLLHFFLKLLSRTKAENTWLIPKCGRASGIPIFVFVFVAEGGRCLMMQKLHLEESLRNICFFR